MRTLVPEIMDDPALAPDDHAAALAGLARINRLSLAARSLYPFVRRIVRAAGGRARMVDIATGSADVPIALAHLARRDGLDLDLVGCDVSGRALEHATARARAAAVPFRAVELDVVRQDPPPGDVVLSTLFLHHLNEPDATAVLERMGRSAARAVVINDLRRGRWGTTLAAVVPRVLTRSRVVHVDAPRSARAAFTIAELDAMANAAGLRGARTRPAFPARMTLAWERPA